jgi:hypothetical protein
MRCCLRLVRSAAGSFLPLSLTDLYLGWKALHDETLTALRSARGRTYPHLPKTKRQPAGHAARASRTCRADGT